MDACSDNLWHNSIGYGRTAPLVPYLDRLQNNRLEMMRVARMLWKGYHREVFLEEGRTQFNFPDMKIQGILRKPYITMNILKLITTTTTDLLLGEEPLLRVESEFAKPIMDDLKSRIDLHSIFYGCAKTASWAREAMVEITRWQQQVWITPVKPYEVFPIGQRQPDGQFQSYKRYAVTQFENGTRLLLESTYLPGSIQRACFQLDPAGGKGGNVDLSQWPVKGADGNPLPANESTGIEWNTIVWMANEIDEDEPTSDYDGLLALQDELNSKQTQIARVIAKHSDPKLAAPEASADPQGNIPASADLFYYRTKDEIPQYIVWNAELEAAIADRDFTLNGLCIAAELSPGLLGLEKGAAPDSARKLRLQATKSLARVKRKSAFVKPFIRTAIDTALQMVNAGRRVQLAMGDSAVDLRDGLPVDDLDQANQIALLTGGIPSMSTERAVSLQVPDPVAAAKEYQALKNQASAATPSVLFGDPAVPQLKTSPDAESPTSAAGADGAANSNTSTSDQEQPYGQ